MVSIYKIKVKIGRAKHRLERLEKLPPQCKVEWYIIEHNRIAAEIAALKWVLGGE